MLTLLLVLVLTAHGSEQAVVEPAPPTEVEPAVDDRDSWPPEAWLDALDQRAESLPGIRYAARRTTVRPSREGQSTELHERWRFILLGERFRIDYFGDTARQITSNGTVLVDYVPANRKAIAFQLDRMDPDERASLVQRILERVAVPGFRVGRAEGVTWTFGEADPWQGRPVVVLEGAGRDDSRLRHVVDRERLALLSSEIHDGDQVVLRTEARDLREIHPGVWFPHEVHLRAPDRGGDVRVTMHLTKVAVLTDSPEELFETILDPSIPIEERTR